MYIRPFNYRNLRAADGKNIGRVALKTTFYHPGGGFRAARSIGPAVLAAVLFLCPPRARAGEEISGFDRLTIEQGLSQSTVRAILQDRDGFMWFGTMDGLNRYDGYEFVVFRHDPRHPTTTLTDNDVRSLYEDNLGGIWVATGGGGLSRYHKSTGEFEQFHNDPNDPDALSAGEVTLMFEDSRGSFWVGTEQGLNRYNAGAKTFTRFRYLDRDGASESNNGINCILEDHAGSVWFGTNAGLKKYDLEKGTFRSYDVSGASGLRLGDQKITALSGIDSGRIWVGTESGLYLLNLRAGAIRRYTETETGFSRISGNRITFLATDGNGGIWVGSNRGLDQYDPRMDGFIRHTNPADPDAGGAQSHFTNILRDARGTIWLLSADKTLYSFDRRTGEFASYRSGVSLHHRLTYNRVNCLYEDRSGTIWFGTAGGGLSKLSRGKVKFGMLGNRAAEVNELQNYSVTALAQGPDGRIWIGTAEDGLARYDTASGRLAWYRAGQAGPGGLSDNRVTALNADARGTIWIGTEEGGLHALETSTGRMRRHRYPFDGTVPDGKRRINTLYRDRKGGLWIGTCVGVSRYDPVTDGFTTYDLAGKVRNPGDEFSVTAFHEDYAGTIWMGTSTGSLVRFDPVTLWLESFVITGDNLLRRHNAISALLGDRPDRIWIGTAASGLYNFDPTTGTFEPGSVKEKLKSTRINGMMADDSGSVWLSTNVGLTRFDPARGTVRDYDFSDGLQSNEFNRGAYCRLADGGMLFGGVGGVNRFHPEAVRDNPAIPSIVLASFRKFDREVPVGARDGRVPMVELSHTENFITFEFASTDYTAPERNQYAYFMEGFDEDWVYSGTRRIASYTNLDPGVYTFRFKGSNSDGVWNEQGSSIVISIMPPFWKTSWFQFIGISLLITVVYYGYRWKVNAIHTQKKTLEGLVGDRTRELWDITRELRSARDQLELRVSERTLELRNANETLRSEIIERIETQEELRRLKDFHENLVHTMVEGVSVVDMEGKITYLNPAAATLLGYAPEDLVGRHWSVLVPSGSRDQVVAADERRKKGVSDHYEIQMLRRDGTRVDVFVGGSPIFTGGSLTGTIAVFTNITGLKTAESRIKEQAALIDKARDVIIVTDVSGTITYWNGSAETIYKWSSPEAVGQNVHQLLQDRSDHASLDAARVILEKGEWSGELQHISRDKKTVIMQSRWTLVSDAEGFPKSIMMINTDVTEKVKLEKQFLRAQRMESLGTLASGIAHDLNNVLSPIIMALQILRDKRVDEREKTLLTTMELSAKRGSDIVKQVLMFARGAEGKHEELQLKHVIREMETIVRETFPKSIGCQTDVPKELWPVSGDPTQLHQVLLNLCVNSRDAMMPQGGTLKIAAENVELDNLEMQLQPEKRSGPHIVVSVTDTGCGMQQDTMMKIFEPFFTTKGVGKGTGLGLSTVNGIIKGHGGFINVYSEPGVGSTFRVYLPAVPESVTGRKPDAATSLPIGRGETILLVDDEPAIRQIAKGTLEAYGYRVLTAADGEEAEEVYRQNMKDVVLVITDMMMPVRDGRETIRVLRSITPGLKIVVTSGLVSTEKEDDGWHKQTQAFLAKPFTAEKLLKTLDEVLQMQKN